MRVIQTPDSQRFVGAPSFAALTGAPVLVDEWERDPARGAFPDQTAPDHDPLSHLELVRNADVLLIAPATANTIAKLAARARRQPAHERRARRDLPGRRRSGDEPPHVGARRDAGQRRDAARARRARSSSPRRARWPARTSGAPAASPSPPTLLAAVEALVPAGARPWDGLRVLVTAGGTREPIDAVRYVGNRSSGRMGFALADEAAALGARGDRRRRQRRAQPQPRACATSTSRPRRELRAACEREFPHCDVLLMAAAVADFRPQDPDAGKLKKDRARRPDDRARADDRRAERRWPRSAGRARPRRLRRRARRRARSSYGREKLARKGLDAIVVNDVVRRGHRLRRRWRTRSRSSPRPAERHVPRATKADIARGDPRDRRRLRASAPRGAVRA